MDAGTYLIGWFLISCVFVGGYSATAAIYRRWHR